MSLTISPVTYDDHPDWEALFLAYADFYDVDVRGSFGTVWSWILDPAEPFWADIARGEDGRALGLVQYSLLHRSLSGGQVVYLSDLFTTPDARGHGVGRALIEHVRSFARDSGHGSVRWLTRSDNAAARKLYDSYAPATDFILYSVPSDG